MKILGKTCVNCQKDYLDNFFYCPNCAAMLTVGDDVNEEQKDLNYSITFVEAKKTRMSLLLMFGATLVVVGIAISGLVSSIYNSEAFVASIEYDSTNVVSIYPEPEMKLEPEPISKNPKKKGGGGNGGDEDPNPVSKGELASQSENPLMSPSVSMIKLTKPEIPVQVETKGVVKRKLTDDKYGNPDSPFDVESDGIGQNGGQGTGSKRGQGTGNGPGGGPGEGIDYGSRGNGPGGRKTVDKEDEKEKPPTFKSNPNSGVNTGLNIIDKPRPIYTDAARENGTQGTVTLRVTFHANGTIGSIIAISGLPHGLTEQAIAAAQKIKFEPVRKNGIAQTVTKQIAYSFILY